MKDNMFKIFKFEYKVAILYFIIGIVWIYLSDIVFNNTVIDKQTLNSIHIIKDFSFVLTTALFLFYCVRKHLDKLLIAEHVMKKRNEEINAQNSELLKAKETAQESEHKFSAIINQASEGVSLTDLNGKYTFVNAAFCKMTGYTEEELLKMSVVDLKANTQIPGVFIESLTKKEGVPIQVILKRKDETEFFAEVIGRLIKIGSQEYALGIIRDITERRHVEEALQESQQRLVEILDFLPDATFAIDREGKVIAWNHAIEEMTGTKAEQMLGKGNYEYSLPFYGTRRPILIDLVFLNTEEIEKYYHSVTKEGEVLMAEANVPVRGEAPRSLWGKAVPLYDSKGNVVGGIESIRDINERKQAELLLTEKNKEYVTLNEELILRNDEYSSLNEEYIVINRELNQTNEKLLLAKEKAEENDRLKTAFLQNISHEIRTPMNAIIGFSGFLNEPGLSKEKQEHFTHIIQTSSYQLLSVVTDIITISTLETKQEKLNITPVCINKIFADVLVLFKAQALHRNVLLNATLPLTDKQTEVYTDKMKLTQILINLITNAFKFTQKGSIEIGYNLQNNELEFYVKDSGIGIMTEKLDKIFERFLQADNDIQQNYGGTGLGLSISKGFVELMGGRIWVQSEFGKGSIFYFTIPYNLVTKTEETDTIPKQNTNIKMSDRTILVAEDDEYSFLLMETLLTEMDFKLLHAKDGSEAVEMSKETPHIDLILMDIKMPIMDGYTAAKAIKEIRPSLPIIAQTAYALEHEKAKYSETAFDDYITKPIKEVVLKEIILKYINK